MKKILLAAVMLAFICLAFKAPKKMKIIFFGDSITQMGINKGGYIDRMQMTINEKKLQDKYELVGAGVGGNKIYDLYLRIEEDVLNKKPDVVIIYEGVNDVWHKTSGTGTDLDKYEKFYIAVIKKLQAQKAQLLLVTPACIGEMKANANQQDDDLDKYCDVIRKLSKTYNTKLVDLRQMTKDYEDKNNIDNKDRGLLTTDKVHLTDTGNQMVADALLNALQIQ